MSDGLGACTEGQIQAQRKEAFSRAKAGGRMLWRRALPTHGTWRAARRGGGGCARNDGRKARISRHVLWVSEQRQDLEAIMETSQCLFRAIAAARGARTWNVMRTWYIPSLRTSMTAEGTLEDFIMNWRYANLLHVIMIR